MLPFAGCTKSGSIILKDYPPRAEDHPIDVLTSAPTDRKFEETAVLDTQGGQFIWSDRTTAGIVEKMKNEARQVGADAIIVRSTKSGSYNWGQGGFNRAEADAIALRYLP